MDDHESYKICSIEVTHADRVALLEQFNRIKDRCHAILEIGVNRNGGDSFTQVFLANKLPDTFYLGVDLDDKSFLNNPANRIFTIAENSSNIDVVMEYAKHVGIDGFDFIFIDGNHCTNQVLRDWEYTRYLRLGGIVGMHDTAYHSGPSAFMQNMNTDIWCVVPNAITYPDDYGIGFAWKK